jgi:hypothetical protein
MKKRLQQIEAMIKVIFNGKKITGVIKNGLVGQPAVEYRRPSPVPLLLI